MEWLDFCDPARSRLGSAERLYCLFIGTCLSTLQIISSAGYSISLSRRNCHYLFLPLCDQEFTKTDRRDSLSGTGPFCLYLHRDNHDPLGVLRKPFDFFVGTYMVRGLQDTIMDLFLGLFGALVFSLLYKRH